MSKHIPELLRKTTQKEIDALKIAARQAYENDQTKQAAKLWIQAADLAKEIEDERQIVNLLFWAGDAFYLMDKLKDSLAVSYEALGKCW